MNNAERKALGDEAEGLISIITKQSPATWMEIQNGIVRLVNIVRKLAEPSLGRPAKTKKQDAPPDDETQAPRPQSSEE